ncbi:peptidylprolyl isomerase [Marinicella litoralis]|uniref:Peptidyl-prolyl cis-trans isomerase n=1 Tax=Marinicella litoralis TaxID=644220 RepID=A0A4R6XIY0_9GAMM|nr:peptidyl-prolyl cis-trans isomerase B (cyclophilin B) [Marinicella litoralis]
MKKSVLFIILALSSTQILGQNTLVKMATTEGDIYLQLADDKAPNSVKNFLSYANEGFYNGTIFHRVISTFMIQGGGFTEDLERKPTKDPIENEANNGLKNLRGTISMARLPDPHSATAQFFINVQDNAALNFTGEQNTNTWGYAVFGQVVRGMDVVDEIRFTPTAGKMPFRKDVPITNVVIKSVEVIDRLPATDSVD